MEFIAKQKRELLYVAIFFAIGQLALVVYEVSTLNNYIVAVLFELVLLFVWLITTYFKLRDRRVSIRTSAQLRVSLTERIFPFVITPTLFISLLFVFLYLSKNSTLRQLILVLCSGYLFLLLVHIKNSYLRMYSLAKITRVIFNFVDIFTFYLGSSSIYLLPLKSMEKFIATSFLICLLLWHQLKIYKQKSIKALLIFIVSAGVLLTVLWFAATEGIFIAPVITTIVFYLVVSFWYIKLSGHRKLDEYIVVTMFALMALIVVLSF